MSSRNAEDTSSLQESQGYEITINISSLEQLANAALEYYPRFGFNTEHPPISPQQAPPYANTATPAAPAYAHAERQQTEGYAPTAQLATPEYFHAESQHTGLNVSSVPIDQETVDGKPKETTQTSLHDAIFERNVGEVKRILKNRGVSELSKTNENGDTAFMVAAKIGSKELCEVLVKEGGKDFLKKPENNLAIHAAVRGGHHSVVEYLVKDQKVDLTLRDNEEHTPDYYAARLPEKEILELLQKNQKEDNQEEKKDLLRAATQSSNVFDYLMKSSKDKWINAVRVSAQTNIKEDEINIYDLIKEILYNRPDNCRKFLAKKPDLVYEKGKEFLTPLLYAAKLKRVECFKEIVKTAKRVKMDVNQKDYSGKTALHYAAEMGCDEICEFLIQSLKPDLDLSPLWSLDNDDCLPLHLAAKNGQLRCCQLLYSADNLQLYFKNKYQDLPIDLAFKGFIKIEDETDDTEKKKKESSDAVKKKEKSFLSVKRWKKLSGSAKKKEESSDAVIMKEESNDAVIMKEESNDAVIMKEESSDTVIMKEESRDAVFAFLLKSNRQDALFSSCQAKYVLKTLLEKNWPKSIESLIESVFLKSALGIKKNHIDSGSNIKLENYESDTTDNFNSLVEEYPDLASKVLDIMEAEELFDYYIEPEKKLTQNHNEIEAAENIEEKELLLVQSDSGVDASLEHRNNSLPEGENKGEVDGSLKEKNVDSSSKKGRFKHPLKTMVEKGDLTLLRHRRIQEWLNDRWTKGGYCMYCLLRLLLRILTTGLVIGLANNSSNWIKLGKENKTEQIEFCNNYFSNNSLNVNFTEEHKKEMDKKIVYFRWCSIIWIFVIFPQLFYYFHKCCDILKPFRWKSIFSKEFFHIIMKIFIKVMPLFLIIPHPTNECEWKLPIRGKLQWQCGVVSVLFQSMYTLQYCNSLPFLSVNLPLTSKLLKSVGKLVIIFGVIVSIFAFIFQLTLDHQQQFNSYGQSWMQTFVWLRGDLGYKDIFVPEDDNSKPLLYVFFSNILFLVFVTMVVAFVGNVLVSNTTDTFNNIRVSGEINRYNLAIEICLKTMLIDRFSTRFNLEKFPSLQKIVKWEEKMLKKLSSKCPKYFYLVPDKDKKTK